MLAVLYATNMTVTQIDLDEDALARAMTELGTKTKKDTVNAALKFAAERTQRSQDHINKTHQEMLDAAGIGEDIDNPEVMKGAWR